METYIHIDIIHFIEKMTIWIMVIFPSYFQQWLETLGNIIDHFIDLLLTLTYRFKQCISYGFIYLNRLVFKSKLNLILLTLFKLIFKNFNQINNVPDNRYI